MEHTKCPLTRPCKGCIYHIDGECTANMEKVDQVPYEPDEVSAVELYCPGDE